MKKNANDITNKATERQMRKVLLIVTTVIVVSMGAAFWAFSHAMKAETCVRYHGLQDMIASKMVKTLKSMETNAKNVFDEVGKHLDSPEAVIAALESKTSLAPNVRGYFAAFEPEYFPEKGRWFEPYVHQYADSSDFVLSMVGSARHDYTRSAWFVKAKELQTGFWSDPYFYYDGTGISGHYCTFVKPVFDADGKLACVCGADITFDWLTKQLQRIDAQYQDYGPLNEYRMMRDLNFYSVIIDKGGSCIVHPDNKKLPITDEELLHEMQQNKCGTLDMTVNGEASTLYYGPIEGVDWTLIVVTPKQDEMKPILAVGIGLLVIAIVCVMIVWLTCRGMKND